ncbi:hypothetical protein C9890_0254 [Perkinsus sp. BL_2016]|nr:hypothetical protein C9890_0254 [Perkinsus sp. BL_2016]
MGASKVLEALLQGGADVEDGGDKPWTPLVVATAAGQVASVRVLLEYGAHRNFQYEDGRTALHEAVDHQWSGHEQGDKKQQTIQTQYLDIVKLLIKADADIEISDSQGRTPLDLAREINNTKAINLLSKAKPRKYQITKKPLMIKENELAPLTKLINRGRSSINLLPELKTIDEQSHQWFVDN